MDFRKILIAFVALVVGWTPVQARQVWSAADVPIPYLRNSTQYVSDPDGYLTKAEKDSANHYLQKLNLECGVQNVFVVVGRVKDQDAFRMAQDLGNKYGVGYKSSRRGLVVVVAVEDHRYFIAPGMGLEGELTDVDCNDIAQACIVKYMREDKPGEAVLATSRAIYNKVKSGRMPNSDTADEEITAEDWPFIILILLLCFGYPLYILIRYVLEELGVVKKRKPKKKNNRRRNDDNDLMPPFIMMGGGGRSRHDDGFSGGSFGGGSFGGGGSGGSW